MKTVLEVCIDSIESLPIAISAGADRIELCSALALGGLTPTAGYARKAIEKSSVPIFPIIRHRAGDFVFDNDEIDIMVADIELMNQLGAKGVVVGALTEEGEINEPALRRFVEAAQGIEVTFHRAFDVCSNPFESLEILIKHGCERVLTSGQKSSADAGTPLIKALVQQAADRIIIMPGAGINSGNAHGIISGTGASELHLSGKTVRPGKMITTGTATMGDNADDDQFVTITDYNKVNNTVSIFR